jgi:hypothetical protein
MAIDSQNSDDPIAGLMAILTGEGLPSEVSLRKAAEILEFASRSSEDFALSSEQELPLLRNAQIYYVGSPSGQQTPEDYYVKGEHPIEFVRELMTRSGQGENVYIMIGAPTTNLEKKSGSLEKAKENARLIGVKECIYYEMLGVTVFQDIIDRSSPIADVISGLPQFKVVLSSDFTEFPEFKSLYKKVEELFKKDLQFRELVYACIPKGQRHRNKNRVESYKELEDCAAQNGKDYYAPLDHINKVSEYVFYQTALVIFLGGHKIGPQREELYNAVAEYAVKAFGMTLEERNLSFEN